MKWIPNTVGGEVLTRYLALLNERHDLWNRTHSIGEDRAFVARAADAILDDPELSRCMQENPHLLIELICTATDKARHSVPLFFNTVQAEFMTCYVQRRQERRPFFILKGRQQGFTTLITAWMLVSAISVRHFAGVTIAHRSEAARSIFADKGRAMYESLPERLKPTERYHNAGELSFSKLGSSWRVSTAGEDTFRGSTLDLVHLSEAAFYDHSLASLQASLGETLSTHGSIILETTANGWNDARALWTSGSCINLFFPWWKSEEYRAPLFASVTEKDPWLCERQRFLRQNVGLDEGQIAWYTRKYAGMLEHRMIRQEYPCSADEAFISSGECYFDIERLQNRLLALENQSPLKRGRFTYHRRMIPTYEPDGSLLKTDWVLDDVDWVEEENGIICIWEEPKTKQKRSGRERYRARYVIGGDTAGTGTDYFTASVLCTLDGSTVATLRVQHIEEDVYAEQILCLALWYNEATVALETNFSAHPVQVLEQKYNYPALYRRGVADGSGFSARGPAGFITDRQTRPLILAELCERMRNPELERDPVTLREMCTFVRGADGRAAAANGAHDDTVMALAIANHVCRFVSPDWERVDGDVSYESEQAKETENYIDW